MTTQLDAALDRAVDLAARGPLPGGNPRVGCVVLDAHGQVLGEGWHRGAGTAHAETAALADVVRRHPATALVGATAVVTLEPCNHTGRTGPCSQALLTAGVGQVVYAVADPDPCAAGGAAWLAARGVDVRSAREAGLDHAARSRAEDLVRPWTTAVRRGRPWVIGKTATTLDGRVAAADRTSRWITGPGARAHAHTVRAEVDAIVVGTGTVLTDDPALTARDTTGDPVAHQPLRVVVGTRDVPPRARLRRRPGTWLHLPTRELRSAFEELYRRGVRRLLVEGGPTVLTAALREGLVDELHAYVAPALLGAGPGAVGDIGIRTIRDAVRWQPYESRLVGEDVFLAARQAEERTDRSTHHHRATQLVAHRSEGDC